MDESLTYEYVVDKKSAGKKTLFILLYVLFAATFFTVMCIVKLYALIAFIVVFTWALIFFTWRYANVSYEYSMTSGALTFSEIYGNRSRKKICEFKIKDCSLIAPLNDEKYQQILAEKNPEKSYVGLANKNSENAYFALFTDKNGKSAVYSFEATDKTLKILRYYNSTNTIIK